PVRFTVDAYPRETFQGVVSQIRLNATMTQNVVTYTVVVDTDNAHGKLLPYLTANVLFEVSRRPAVLQVPNAALRWKPKPEQVVPELRADFVRSQQKKPADDKSVAAKGEHGFVWLEDHGFVRPVPVQVGLSDGAMTEISADGIDEGTPVVVGERRGPSGEP